MKGTALRFVLGTLDNTLSTLTSSHIFRIEEQSWGQQRHPSTELPLVSTVLQSPSYCTQRFH